MALVNYVVVLWSGPRPRPHRHSHHTLDPSFYFRRHLRYLKTVPHSLAQITLVIQHNPNEPEAFRQVSDSVPPIIQNAKVEILHRPN